MLNWTATQALVKGITLYTPTNETSKDTLKAQMFMLDFAAA